MCSFIYLNLNGRIPLYVKSFTLQIRVKSIACWNEEQRQQNSGFGGIEWNPSQDKSHQQNEYPGLRRVLHALLVFCSIHFFQMKHFMKSLCLAYRISNSFLISLAITRSHNQVQTWYSVSFVLCFVKGPVILLYLTWWFKYGM